MISDKEKIRREKLAAFWKEKKEHKCRKCGATVSASEMRKLRELKIPLSRYRKCLKCHELENQNCV